MLRIETSLSPAECMARLLSVADLDLPDGPVSIKNFVCTFKGDRFSIRRGSASGRSIQTVFYGPVRPHVKGAVIQGRFLCRQDQLMILIVWLCVMAVLAGIGPYRVLTGQAGVEELFKGPEWLLLILTFTLFGCFWAHLHGEDAKRITELLCGLFGRECSHP